MPSIAPDKTAPRYRQLTARRLVARRLSDGRVILPMQFVDLTGPRPLVTPFRQEEHSTIFVDDTVMLLLPDGSPLQLSSLLDNITPEASPEPLPATSPEISPEASPEIPPETSPDSHPLPSSSVLTPAIPLSNGSC